MPRFSRFCITWKLLNANINMGHENYAICKYQFQVCVSTDAAFCSTLAALIWPINLESKQEIWIHIKHCFSSAAVIWIQQLQLLLCIDAAASDASNLCTWYPVNLVYIFWEFWFQSLIFKSLPNYWHMVNSITSYKQKHQYLLHCAVHTLGFYPNLVKYCFKNMFLKEPLNRWSSLQTKEGQIRSEFRLVGLQNS